MNRILKELFSAGDRRLINLYDKALQKLDSMLSNPGEEKQFRAVDRIIRIYFSRSAKNAVTIQQYFGIQAQNENDFIQSIDQLILKMRKERGLPEPWEDILKETILEVREERGLPELSDQSIQDIISKVLNEPGLPERPNPKDGCDSSSHNSSPPGSSPENSTPGNALQDGSSQHAPSQRTLSQEAPSPNVPSANTPSSNHPSREAIDEFVKLIGSDESII